MSKKKLSRHRLGAEASNADCGGGDNISPTASLTTTWFRTFGEDIVAFGVEISIYDSIGLQDYELRCG